MPVHERAARGEPPAEAAEVENDPEKGAGQPEYRVEGEGPVGEGDLTVESVADAVHLLVEARLQRATEAPLDQLNLSTEKEIA